MTKRTAISRLAIAVSLAGLAACSGKNAPSEPSALAGGLDTLNAATAGASGTVVTMTGTISALTGACPSVTFTYERKTVRTNAATAYGDIRCAGLANDVRIAIAASTQADGSLLALKISPIATATPVAVTLTGTIASLRGTCPVIGFMLAGKSIVTNAATGFGDGNTCAVAQNDLQVTVTGTAQADGSILATRVLPVPAPVVVPTVSITGAVTRLNGTCPAITIGVGEKFASTTAQTMFRGKGCGDLKVGSGVAIFGKATASATAVMVADSVVTR